MGGFELSQMLIIAGALLLVCGGLMLGGGLLMRAGAGSSSSAVTAASPSEPIAWLFEHKTLPIDERSVFAYVATPDGVRIKGFAIGGVNLSEQPVGALEGIVKPDAQAHDLKLTLSVEMPGDHEGGAQSSEARVAAVPDGTVPSQAPFRLVFLFPSATDGGMTPHDVLAAYGGLMLKVRYEVDGTAEILHPISAAGLAGGAARRDRGWRRRDPRPRLEIRSATLRSTAGSARRSL